MLEILFAIESEAIRRDLRRAEEEFDAIGDELALLTLATLRPDTRPPQTYARLAHLSLIHAHELCRRETVVPEMRTFYAANGAERVTENAAAVARKQDATRMDAIRDTIFAFALRRYQMDEIADLFENDRIAFEIQREIGRRGFHTPRKETEAVEKLMDDYFRNRFGAKVLQRIQTRAKEIRDVGWRESAPATMAPPPGVGKCLRFCWPENVGLFPSPGRCC